MVCVRYIIVNTLHTGDNKDNNNNEKSIDSPYVTYSSDVLRRIINKKSLVTDPTL